MTVPWTGIRLKEVLYASCLRKFALVISISGDLSHFLLCWEGAASIHVVILTPFHALTFGVHRVG